ncbi:MAG: DUF1700 domain-containing protein [Clostridia bacterium]|nr:DUF1700 domain-containing protein [Clostridia bacterium]
MTKLDFLSRLDTLLRGMRPAERKQWLDDYGELIEDRIEDGLTEADAVAAMGDVYDIARQIRTDAGLPADASESDKTTRRKVLLWVCTAPLWIPAGLTAAAVALGLAAAALAVVIGVLALVLALCGTVIALVAGLYGAVIGLAVGGIAATLGGALLIFPHPLQGLFVIGTGLVLTGLAAPVWMLCFMLHRLLKGLFHKTVSGIRCLMQRLARRKECVA